MYRLYKIINAINGKHYIGITKSTLAKRWSEHLHNSLDPKYPLHRAISKYGKDYFSIEMVLESDDRTYISTSEDPMIELYQSRITQHGYNVAIGGYGGDLGASANAKRRRTMIDKSPEEKQTWIDKRNITIAGRTKYNHPGKLQQSMKLIGNRNAEGLVHSTETKKIIGLANIGPKSIETRQRMSNSAIVNNNGKRFAGRRISCICCNKEWDIGNYTQHIRKIV